MIMQEYREAMDVVETDSSRSWSGDVCMWAIRFLMLFIS
jgi:hypothetical protein